MFQETLREAGLSLNEARVYQSLLLLGDSSVQDIALKSKVHRRNVYDSMAMLLEKGLASEVFIKGEKHYRPIGPSRLLDIIKEKEERLTSILPELEKNFSANREKEEAYLYRGIQGFKNYLQDILETGETAYFIGAKAFWLDPRLRHFLPRFEKERKKKGIEFMHIFDHEVKEQMPEILDVVGKPYKFFPEKYSSPAAVDIFGPYVVTFVGDRPGHLHEQPVQFVLKSRRLADGYRQFFRFMWDMI